MPGEIILLVGPEGAGGGTLNKLYLGIRLKVDKTNNKESTIDV